MDISVVSTFLASMSNATKYCFTSFCVDMFSFLLGICLGVELLGHIVIVCLPYLSPAVYGGSRFSSSMPTRGLSFLKSIIIAILVAMK